MPLPRPSSAPEEVTEKEDTRKPAQMMRSAVAPICMVSALEVKRDMSCAGMDRHSSVPKAMMTRVMESVVK